MAFVGSARDLIGSVSHWLPKRRQLPGLLVHTVFSEFLDSWVVGPIAICIPASAWVAPHQLWCMQTAPWQIPACSWGWGCRMIVWRDIEDAVGSRGERGIAETITAGGWGHGEELRGFAVV